MGTVTLAYGEGRKQQENAVYYIAGGLIIQLLAFLFFVFMAVRVEKGLKAEGVGVLVTCGLERKWKEVLLGAVWRQRADHSPERDPRY